MLAQALTEEAQGSQQRFPDLEYFGQMHGTYLLLKISRSVHRGPTRGSRAHQVWVLPGKIGQVTDDLQELWSQLSWNIPIVMRWSSRNRQKNLAQVGIHLKISALIVLLCGIIPWYPPGKKKASFAKWLICCWPLGRFQWRNSGSHGYHDELQTVD